MNHVQIFRSRVEQFLRRTKVSASRLGVLACHDPRFVYDLRRGREPRLSTMERVDRFMIRYGSKTREPKKEPDAPDQPKPRRVA